MLRDIHEGGKPKKKQAKKWTDGRRFESKKLGMMFRSNWEIFVAELLHELDITFEFEPQRVYFRAERESYLCDFFLPDYNCWIEIKGYMDKRSEKRVKLFRKYYGATTGFFLIEKEEMELLKSDPKLIYALIEAAQQEQRRKASEKQL